jgi:hypothetical protein
MRRRGILLAGLASACGGGAAAVTAAPVVVPLPAVAASAPASAAVPSLPCSLTCEVGAPCGADASEDGYACTEDGTKRLQCRAGSYQISSVCKGPKGCAVSGGKAVCDDSFGDIGDLCIHQPDDTNYACSTDGLTEVVCDPSGRFRPADICRGPKACHVADDRVYCDRTLGREGELCRPLDNHTCSEDGSAELKCSAELRWVRQRACPSTGCNIQNGQVFCQ